MATKAPALSSTVEQGNFLSEPPTKTTNIVDLRFDESSSVFLEHLNETNGKDKLKNHIIEFFEIENTDFELRLDVFTEKDQSKKSFQSFAEKKREEIEERARKERSEFKRK